MNAIKILGIILVIAGILGLAYGKFSFTKDSHVARMGPMEFTVKDRETVNIPLWAGVVAIVAGGALLFVPAKHLPGN